MIFFSVDYIVVIRTHKKYRMCRGFFSIFPGRLVVQQVHSMIMPSVVLTAARSSLDCWHYDSTRTTLDLSISWSQYLGAKGLLICFLEIDVWLHPRVSSEAVLVRAKRRYGWVPIFFGPLIPIDNTLDWICSVFFFMAMLFRGTIVIRTYGIDENLYT